MRHIRFYILFALIISLFASSSASGQRRGRTRMAEKTFIDEISLSATTLRDVPAKRAFNHNEKIDWRYDNVKDITVVNLDKMWVGPHLRLSAYFGCYGQGCDESTPSYVRIFLTTSSPGGWRLGRMTPVVIRADGRRKRVQPEYEREVQPAKLVGGSTYGPYYAEYLKFDLSTRVFLSLVNSKSVEMQVGKIDVKFNESQMEALRDLASRLPVKP
jgi:hypothetical protein